MGLVVAALALATSGCRSNPEGGATPTGEGPPEGASFDEDSLEIRTGSSPMLERLRESNQRAAIEDRRGDLGEMEAQLRALDDQIAAAERSGEDTTVLQSRRTNLERTLRQERELLERLGE